MNELSPSMLLTLAFAAALAVQLLVQLWLNTRQVRHVALHRGQVPALFAPRISLAAHQKAADYTLVKARLGVAHMAWSVVILLGWTLLGGLDALHAAWLRVLHPGLLQQLAVLASFAVISGLLDLPFSLYQTFVVEARFGFNKSTWSLWLVDLCKGSLLAATFGLPIAAAILWLMGAVGAWWWLWAWGFWTAFQLLLMWIFPSFIAPFFNKFEPLADEGLKSRVTMLMQRCGFSPKGLFVMDGSRRSAHANAYFTGFGASKRVVFYDTLLKQLSAAEVEAVLAHELGHFKHKHIAKRMLATFVLSLLGFALLGWLAQQSWFYAGLGVTPGAAMFFGQPAHYEALALLLFLLVMPVFTFWASPLVAHFSRRDEFEADAYAMQQAEGSALASALIKLYQDNASTLTPDPVYARYYYSHPPAVERLSRMPAPSLSQPAGTA